MSIAEVNDHVYAKAVPIGQTIHCELRRERPGLKDDDPIFVLYSNSTQEPILYCMRSGLNETTLSVGKPSEGLFWEKAVARLKSNFVQTKFEVYSVSSSGPVFEMASIRYIKSSMGLNGPRRMTVLLPPLKEDEVFERVEASPEGKSVLIARNELGKQVISLTNKEPVWCEETGSYVLNFDGRVSFASIKNFQLVHPRDRTPIY